MDGGSAFVNFIMLVLGLTICFGGIYLRRICSGILGFIWGILLSFVFLLMTVGLWEIDSESSLFTMMICGILMAILSAIYYKVCVAINSFAFTTFIILIFGLLADNSDETTILIIAILIGLVVAGISVVICDYSFVLMTAISGAFIASIGGFGLIHDVSMSDIISHIIWYGFEDVQPIFVATFFLSIIGFIVQLLRLQKIHLSAKTETNKTDDTESISPSKSESSKMSSSIKDALSPTVQNIGEKTKSTWKSINTEENRAELKVSINKEKKLLIVPCILFFLIPFLYFILNHANIGTYGIYRFLDWLNRIAYAITLAILVYFACCETRIFCGCFVGCTVLWYLIRHFSDFSSIGLGVRYTLVNAFEYLFVWGILILISKIIKKKTLHPLIMTACTILFAHFLFYKLMFNYWTVSIDWRTVVSILITFGTVYFLFDKLENHNIFNFQEESKSLSGEWPAAGDNGTINNNSSFTPQSITKCSVCGGTLNEGDLFCANCGHEVVKLTKESSALTCTNCGTQNPEGSKFCKQCGQLLV